MGEPFAIDPADVPQEAVDFVVRTLLRHAGRGPLDDYVARVITAGVITVLAREPEAGPGSLKPAPCRAPLATA